MKSYLVVFGFSWVALLSGLRSQAQAEEAAQLVLNLEKLAQFRQILSDLKKGYDILFGGYTTIKNIAEGNFSLHKVFLDGLLEVSPTVRNYKRIADIIDYQLRLVKEYKTALNRFKTDGNFSPAELDYMETVYSRLLNQSLKNLEALTIVITSGKARMSDDERIRAIDDIFHDIEDKLMFQRWFTNSATVLSIQRIKDKNDVRVMRKLYNTE